MHFSLKFDFFCQLTSHLKYRFSLQATTLILLVNPKLSKTMDVHILSLSLSLFFNHNYEVCSFFFLLPFRIFLASIALSWVSML